MSTAEYGSSAPGSAGLKVITVDGEIDTATAPALRRQLSEQLESADCRVLVVDLAAVRFFGVAGVNALMAAQERALAAGVVLRLVVVSRIVHRVLQVVGVEQSFTVYPTRADAVGADARRGAT